MVLNKHRVISYQKLVEKLIYLSYTRPDTWNAVSFVSHFIYDPTNENLKADLRILRYLKAVPEQY